MYYKTRKQSDRRAKIAATFIGFLLIGMIVGMLLGSCSSYSLCPTYSGVKHKLNKQYASIHNRR